MAEHAGKPKVRFAGFTEAWEQRKLGEIADKVTEKNTTLRYTEALRGCPACFLILKGVVISSHETNRFS